MLGRSIYAIEIIEIKSLPQRRTCSSFIYRSYLSNTTLLQHANNQLTSFQSATTDKLRKARNHAILFFHFNSLNFFIIPFGIVTGTIVISAIAAIIALTIHQRSMPSIMRFVSSIPTVHSIPIGRDFQFFPAAILLFVRMHHRAVNHNIVPRMLVMPHSVLVMRVHHIIMHHYMISRVAVMLHSVVLRRGTSQHRMVTWHGHQGPH